MSSKKSKSPSTEGRKKKKSYESFKTSISRLFHDQEMRISSKATILIDRLVKFYVKRIIKNVNVILSSSKKKTLSSQMVDWALLVTFPDYVSKKTIAYAEQKKEKYLSSKGEKGKITEKAGLTLPTSRIKTLVNKNIVSLDRSVRVSMPGVVFLTAAVEYTIRTLLTDASKVATASGMKTLFSKHIYKAIHEDERLKVMSCGVLMGGGVMPTTVARKRKSKK